MTTILYLAAVAGLLVIACCTRVENTHLSSPVLPMQVECAPDSPLKKASLTGFHATAKHIAAKAVSPSSETMRVDKIRLRF